MTTSTSIESERSVWVDYEFDRKHVTTAQELQLAREVLDLIWRDERLWDQGSFVDSDAGNRAEIDLSSIPFADHHFSAEFVVSVDREHACGTSQCFAGWVCLVKGKQLVWPMWVARYVPGSIGDAGGYAASQLGLPEFAGWNDQHMFDADNDLQDLQSWVDAMTDSYRNRQPLVDILFDRGLINRLEADKVRVERGLPSIYDGIQV